jgi:hypothetical protein
MASALRAIMAQVQDAIQTANGSGVYTHDLSATGTVVRGAVLDPPASSVAVGVYVQSVATTPGARLGYFERTMTVGIHGWASHDGTEGDSEDTASDLLDDILRTLESDRSLGSRVRDLTASGVPFSGTTLGIDGWAMVAIDLEINWSQETGV